MIDFVYLIAAWAKAIRLRGGRQIVCPFLGPRLRLLLGWEG
jgi:hypothetical protein